MTPVSPPDLPRLVAAHFGGTPPHKLAVAVSGGGDSMALLVACDMWRQAGGPEIEAVTVDHGLRAGSAEEAAWVARFCAARDLPHTILHWQNDTGSENDAGWDGHGNLPDQARRARYDLMAKWAQGRDIADLMLGHTCDDQAETFLMRLQRGAGVDGLSAMASQRHHARLCLHRPLLSVSRAELREYLTAQGVGWCEDPGNEDPSYDRVRIRQALSVLADLGISGAQIGASAAHLRRAREALAGAADQAIRTCLYVEHGDIIVDRKGFAHLPQEIRRRVLNAAILWLNGADYTPRAEPLLGFCDAIDAGETATLGGCVGYLQQATYRITREYAAVARTVTPVTEIWDGRWRLTGSQTPGESADTTPDREIRALGDNGWTALKTRENALVPYRSAIATPAIWCDCELIAAPLAGLSAGWSAELVGRAVPGTRNLASGQ